MKWLVYLHYRLDTGECFYIGKGTEKRSKAKDQRNKYWKNIVGKAGYKIVIANYFQDEQDALSYEIDLIARFNPSANITSGGEGVSGLKQSEATKEKCRQSTLALRSNPEWLENNLVKMKEAVSTVEVRTKMSAHRKEYFKDSANKLNMSIKQSEFIKNNPERNAIRMQKSIEARQTEEFRTKAALAQGAKPFLVFKDGTLVGEWLVGAICSQQLSVHKSTITRCLQGKQAVTNSGYSFKYKEAA